MTTTEESLRPSPGYASSSSQRPSWAGFNGPMSTPSRPLGSLRDQGLGRDAGHRLRGRRGRHVGGRVRLRLGRVPQDAAESRVGRRLQRAPCAPTRPTPLSKSPPRGPAGANVTGWRYSRHASRSPAKNGVYLGETISRRKRLPGRERILPVMGGPYSQLRM